LFEVGKNMPLKVLLVWAVTAEKFKAFKVLAPVELAVPVNPKTRLLEVLVPEEALLVRLKVSVVVAAPVVEVVCPPVVKRQVGQVAEPMVVNEAVVPFESSTVPLAPGAIAETAVVPLPCRIPLADKVEAPVPPWATLTAVKPVPNDPAVKAPTPVIPVYDPAIPAD